jgi:hypothetical protein
MLLSSEQRSALKLAASVAPRYDRIDAIDALIAQLRLDNPGAFHHDSSLHERAFIHQPRAGAPCRAFCYPFPQEHTTASI